MKNFTKFVFGFALATQMVLMPGCGKKNNAATNDQGTCAAGQVYNSSYGCLQASPGMAGYGMYNGQPVVGTCWGGTIMTQNGCLPQGNCQLGQALYNNTCISATTNTQYNNGNVNGYSNGYNNGYNNYGNTGYSGNVYTNTSVGWYWNGYTWIYHY